MSYKRTTQHKISRLDFLNLAGITSAGITASGCSTKPESSESNDALKGDTDYKHSVAIAHANEYDPLSLRTKIKELFDLLDELDDVIGPGVSFSIKINLEGGYYYDPYPGFDPIESYVTYAEVRRAFGELLVGAGAKRLYIVEAQFDRDSFSRWGYDDVAASLGATPFDFNYLDPYGDFTQMDVGNG